jgi:hypothetical protein
MRAYDQLPPPARHALAEAVENWAPQPILDRYRRGAHRPGQLTGLIRQWDRKAVTRREEERACAVGVYRGNAPS